MPENLVTHGEKSLKLLLNVVHKHVLIQSNALSKVLMLTIRRASTSHHRLLVTLENSPCSSFVFQKIGFVSKKPCLTQPSSLTW